jgi:hypothetical protein
VKLVRAEGLEPSRALRHQRIFVPAYGFRRPCCLAAGFGVWTNRKADCSGRAWLGIAMLQGSPNLSSSAPPVSRRALKFALKSDASADSAAPAQFQT